MGFSFLRHGQPSITNVFPHAGNRRYILGGGGYRLNPVRFDGTDWAARAAYSGVGASDPYTFSFWWLPEATSNIYLMEGAAGGNSVFRLRQQSVTQRAFANVDASGGVGMISIGNVSAGDFPGTMSHIFIHGANGSAANEIYLNGSLVESSTAWVAQVVDWNLIGTMVLGANSGTSVFYNGQLADFYYHNTNQTDLTDFRTTAGNPVDPGADGSGLGNAGQPIAFYGGTMRAADWNAGTNLGTGGPWTNVSSMAVTDV